MTFDLNKHVARLLMDEPFFAALSRRVDKKVGAIPTAGVRVNPETAQFEMLYNPAFFEGLTDVQRAGVLKHEFYHLIFEHVTGRMPEEVKDNAALAMKWNFATDLAINSHLIGQLPDGCLMPGEGAFVDLPRGKSAEWYWATCLRTLARKILKREKVHRAREKRTAKVRTAKVKTVKARADLARVKRETKVSPVKVLATDLRPSMTIVVGVATALPMKSLRSALRKLLSALLLKLPRLEVGARLGRILDRISLTVS